MPETDPGFYFPDRHNPTDKVYLDALVGDNRSDPDFQIVAFSEDHTPKVYTLPIAGGNQILINFDLTIKIGDGWGTDKSFVDLRDFIRQSINQEENDFSFIDANGNNYPVRMKAGSFVYYQIPGSTIWLVKIKLYLAVTAMPTAEFSGTPTSGSAPLTVDFTDESVNATSWYWDFGGEEGTSNEQNPSHEYTTPGTYTVTLWVYNALGTDVEQKTNYITVS